jgi:hypothetical protein
MERLSITLSPEALEALAVRVAELLAERQAPTAQDDWIRGADDIAAYIGAKKSRVYALSSAGRIPVERDGSALVALKSDLDAWIRQGGGRRP